MTEFWERFCFYGMRWALTLYIMSAFYAHSPAGEKEANHLFGAYSGLIYASSFFGGYIADRVIGYQSAILLGAFLLAIGQFFIPISSHMYFLVGLACTVVGSGLFKPNISTILGKVYAESDPRRDRGFTIFYMGINAGSLISPILTGWLAQSVFGTPEAENYKVVFIVSGIGMLISLVWFWLGKKQLKHVGLPPQGNTKRRFLLVLIGALALVPVIYYMLIALSTTAQTVFLTALFIASAAIIIKVGYTDGKVQLHRVYAMLSIFVFNILFWTFFEQAGSSFNFLALNNVDRSFGGWEIPVAWFQSINPIAILVFAPCITIIWSALYKRGWEPIIPAKFAFGLLFNSAAFLLLMYALRYCVNFQHKIPSWPLVGVYLLQTVGELCLSPIGLSMVTKLSPGRLAGLAMGAWFLSIAIAENLAGIFAGIVSGNDGMTISAALQGYKFGFVSLLLAGLLLLALSPFIKKWMHGIN